jgi:hypothetical protein
MRVNAHRGLVVQSLKMRKVLFGAALVAVTAACVPVDPYSGGYPYGYGYPSSGYVYYWRHGYRHRYYRHYPSGVPGVYQPGLRGDGISPPPAGTGFDGPGSGTYRPTVGNGIYNYGGGAGIYRPPGGGGVYGPGGGGGVYRPPVNGGVGIPAPGGGTGIYHSPNGEGVYGGQGAGAASVTLLRQICAGRWKPPASRGICHPPPASQQHLTSVSVKLAAGQSGLYRSPHCLGCQVERFDDPRVWKFGLIIQSLHIPGAASFK